MKQKVIYINEELHASMKSLAAEKKMSLSELIETVLEAFKKLEKK